MGKKSTFIHESDFNRLSKSEQRALIRAESRIQGNNSLSIYKIITVGVITIIIIGLILYLS